MMLCQPWEYKKGSPERGETCVKLAASLTKCFQPVVRVTQRSIRDLLGRKHKRKACNEEKASGKSLEDTEIDQFINEIVSFLEQSDQAEK